MMEGKKISFGFMKSKKAEKPIKPIIEEDKREYIECVEEKSIKVVGGDNVQEDEPLIIPMKPNTLITAERLKEIAEKVESAVNEPEIKDEPKPSEENVPENETLEQMAVRELMQQAKKEVKVEDTIMAIPTPAKPVMDGEKESTLDDYESVPVQQFGLAMLRGMGWTPSKDSTKYKQPDLRPKGLGLGADKVIKENKKKQSNKDNKEEELAIVKNSFVKITTGKYSGYYGKVVSLDEDNGRVMVEITVKKETVSLSEFMMTAVTKSEYDRESKVINQDSYQEYKKNEKAPQKSSRQEERSSSSRKNDLSIKNDRERSNDNYRRDREEKSSYNGRNKSRQRKDSSSSEERSRRKKRDSSSDSLRSLSDDDRRRRKHKSKSKKRYSSSESDSRKKSPAEGKRDIDKKRKGKKKKRDRDRSPNYKKHRK